jgi:hypothetical protein
MDLTEIIQFTDNLDKQAKAIVKETLRLSWYMRGAMSLDEAYMLDNEQTEAINEIIKENFEFTKETKIPFI